MTDAIGSMTRPEDDEERAFRALDAGNYIEAARLYEPLAARGSETALINLGWLYKKGHLGPVDRDKAMALWGRAANAGSARAKYRMGKEFVRAGDLPRARALFLEGANQGHTPSMNRAGKMLMRGKGGEKDYDVGARWLFLAAEKGHVHARRELLRLEIEGARSLPRRIWLWWQVIVLALSAFPRAVRDRYSDDFR